MLMDRGDGWIYGDLPKLTQEYFDKFVEIVGEENLQWLTLAEYKNWGPEGQDLVRGQYFISPQGIENIRNRQEFI